MILLSRKILCVSVSHSVIKCEYQAESVQLCLAYLSDAEYKKSDVEADFIFISAMHARME